VDASRKRHAMRPGRNRATGYLRVRISCNV
jgi:hypothetical protein